ncbi:MAG: rod shape-determining protein MreD [Pseudomonadota bacterium]
MAETPTMQVWTGRLAFAALACVIIFLYLLPLDTRPDIWPVPDFLLLIAVVWTARRPDYAPVAIIAGLFLLADLLFQRPPGLWAGLVVILTELLRRRARQIRNMPLMLEWLFVTVGIIGITLAYRIALAIVVMPQAPLRLTVIQLTMTILVYPVIVGMAHLLFGVSRPAPGQTDSLGHRL